MITKILTHLLFRLLAGFGCTGAQGHGRGEIPRGVHVGGHRIDRLKKHQRVHFRIDRLTGVATRLRPGVLWGVCTCAPVHPTLRFCEMCQNRRYSNIFRLIISKYSSILPIGRGAPTRCGVHLGVHPHCTGVHPVRSLTHNV